MTRAHHDGDLMASYGMHIEHIGNNMICCFVVVWTCCVYLTQIFMASKTSGTFDIFIQWIQGIRHRHRQPNAWWSHRTPDGFLASRMFDAQNGVFFFRTSCTFFLGDYYDYGVMVMIRCYDDEINNWVWFHTKKWAVNVLPVRWCHRSWLIRNWPSTWRVVKQNPIDGFIRSGHSTNLFGWSWMHVFCAHTQAIASMGKPDQKMN